LKKAELSNLGLGTELEEDLDLYSDAGRWVKVAIICVVLTNLKANVESIIAA